MKLQIDNGDHATSSVHDVLMIHTHEIEGKSRTLIVVDGLTPFPESTAEDSGKYVYQNHNEMRGGRVVSRIAEVRHLEFREAPRAQLFTVPVE